MKKLCAVFLILAAVFTIAFAEEGSVKRLEGEGFSSPEDAVLAYIEALNRGDVGGMLSTFAMESLVGNLDTSLYLERQGVFTPASVYGVPMVDDYTRSLILYSRYGTIANDLMQNLIACSTGDNGISVRFKTPEERKAFEEQFQQSPLKDMAGNVAFVQWISPMILTSGSFAAPKVGTDAVLNNLAYGMDDYTELAALVRIGGRYAVQPMACAAYGGRWYNLGLHPTVAMLAPNVGSVAQLALYVLTDAEAGMLMQSLQAVPTEADAVWETMQTCGLGGSRWPMVSLAAPGVSLHNTAPEAESDDGAGVWAEMHFFRAGGAVITIRASQTLQEMLGMEDATARIICPWRPDGIPVAYAAKTGKQIPLIRLIDREEIQLDLNSLDVIMSEDSVTFTFADGTQAVFQKP